MKVLFATYPMAFHTPGGGEMQLHAYRRYLRDVGVEATLFNPWDPRFEEHDLVHFFSCVGGSEHFCAFVKRIGMKLVVSTSLWMTPATRHLYPFKAIRSQLSCADAAVTNSDTESAALAEVLDLPAGLFHTVYNAVDREFLEAADPRLFCDRFDIDTPFLLNVANIEPRKNQLRLVEAMQELPAHRLVLIGHVRDRDYAAGVFEAAGDRVVHVGALDHQSVELRSAYAACDAFVLPSTLETPGLAALEAAAQGARLIVTCEGSCREYFGDDAVYVDPESTPSISAGIVAALENTDVVSRNNLQKRIENAFTWETTVDRLAFLYSDLIKSSS